MADLELVTGILLDPENKMLIVHREDHGQWELPGGKLLAAEQLGADVHEEEIGRLSLRHILRQKLGAEIDATPENLPLVLHHEFEQGGVKYGSRVYQAVKFSGAISVKRRFYDDHDFVYPLQRNVLRRHLSPNFRQFQRSLNNREIELQFNPWNTVQ